MIKIGPWRPTNFLLRTVFQHLYTSGKGKGKAGPLQTWTGPEGSRKLRLPDFMTTAQYSGQVVSLTHRPPLPPGNTPGTHFWGWVDARAIVRSEGFYVKEKFQWYQLGSNQRPSDLWHSILTTVPPRFPHVRYYNKFVKHQWRYGKRHKYFYKDQEQRKFPPATQFLFENCGAWQCFSAILWQMAMHHRGQEAKLRGEI